MRSALFEALLEWVENGKAPTTPMYMYPKKLTYLGADTGLESSYGCK